MSVVKSAKVWLGGASGVTAPIHISQYDTAWEFQFSIYQGSTVYTPSESSSVYMEGRKADGTVFAVPGVFSSGVAVIQCDASITAAVGPVTCELRVSEGDGVVGTANFEIIVEAAPLRGYVASVDDFSAMQQVLDGAEVAASEAVGSKNAAATSAAAAAVSAATAQVSVSSPFVIAATAAAMTDTTKAYVYTGSEEGYTYGGWYYWNGSAWTLGGTAVDPTLTVAGAAADAKETGKIATKAETLTVAVENNDLRVREINGSSTPIYEQGNIQGASDANPGKNSSYRKSYYCRTQNYIPYDSSIRITCADMIYYYVFWYDSNQDYLAVSREIISSVDLSTIVVTNAAYFRILYYQSSSVSSPSSHIVEYPPLIGAVKLHYLVSNQFSSQEAQIASLQSILATPAVPKVHGITEQANYNAQTVLQNVSVRSGHSYTIHFSLDNPIDQSTGVDIYNTGLSSFSRNIASGDKTLTVTFTAAIDSDSVYVTIHPNGRCVGYTIDITPEATDYSEKLRSVDAAIDTATTYENNTRTTLDITKQLTFSTGPMGKDGAVNASDSTYLHSGKIPVSAGDVIFNNNRYTPVFKVVTAFTGDTAVAASGAEDTGSFTVPHGIDYVVVSIYADQSQVRDTVMRTGNHNLVNSASPGLGVLMQEFAGHYSRPKPMVTFIDDDGNVEFYDYLLPIMKKYGIPMVSAYMGDANPDMLSNADMMTAAQCREVVNWGGEVIVHHLPAEGSAARIAGILKSKQVLEDHGFFSRLVAYSDGVSNKTIRETVCKHFDAAFSGAFPRVSNTDRTNRDCIVQYAIHREPCGGMYYDTSPAARSIAYFQSMIDECVAKNSWLVFTIHSFLMPEGKTLPYASDIDQLELLEEIIQYCLSRNVSIVTASEGLSVFGNAFTAGDYLGYWNEQTFSGLETFGSHDVPGCAISKTGQWDFPDSRRIIHG